MNCKLFFALAGLVLVAGCAKEEPVNTAPPKGAASMSAGTSGTKSDAMGVRPQAATQPGGAPP